VLIGALRGEDPAEHLAWIRDKRLYYTPLAKDQPRLFAAGAVAFYEPARLGDDGERGAVRSSAKVVGVRVVRRSEVATPWTTRRGDGDVVVYELGPVVALPRVIVRDEDLSGRPIVARRWNSRLALERARTLSELFLESEPEWRLYEELRAAGTPFRLRAETAKLRKEDELQGRARFALKDGLMVTWRGAAGFVVRWVDGREEAVATARGVTEVLRGRSLGETADEATTTALEAG